MDGKSELLAPRARQKRLVVRELDDEVLVYDLERNQAHCLNQTAGLVWRHCDGQTTISEMTELLRKDLGLAANDQTVWHALVELGKDHLLEEQVSRPTMSRRHMLGKVGVAVTAAAVTSIAVGGVAHAVTCSPACTGNSVCTACLDTGTACCAANTACCRGVCCASGNFICCNGLCCSNSCVCCGTTCCRSNACTGTTCSHVC